MGCSSTSLSHIMKSLLIAAFVVSLSDLSLQFYAPPLIQRLTSGSQENCRQVPKEVCSQVPKTTFETVQGNNVARFPILFVLMSRSASVKSLRDPSSKLFLARNVTLSSEANARLLKISVPSVALFKMKNATMFLSSSASMSQGLPLRPSMKRSAPSSMIRFAQPGLKTNVNL